MCDCLAEMIDYQTGAGDRFAETRNVLTKKLGCNSKHVLGKFFGAMKLSVVSSLPPM